MLEMYICIVMVSITVLGSLLSIVGSRGVIDGLQDCFLAIFRATGDFFRTVFENLAAGEIITAILFLI